MKNYYEVMKSQDFKLEEYKTLVDEIQLYCVL